MEQVDTAEALVRQVDNILILRLLLEMENIERGGEVDDIPKYDCVSEALSYFATPSTLEVLSTRDIPQRWLDIVAAKSSFDRGEVYTGDTLENN